MTVVVGILGFGGGVIAGAFLMYIALGAYERD